MGIDRHWQAVPESWPLYAAALVDGRTCDDILSVANILRSGFKSSYRNPPPEYLADCDTARSLVERHPGLETRCYSDWSRSWDAVAWVLSDWRRDHGEWIGYEALDVGARTVFGSHRFPCDGPVVTYSTAAEVRDIAHFLAPLTEADLRRHDDPAGMEAGGVYKFFAEGMTPEALNDWWTSILSCFEGMRAVYRAAAGCSEAVIVNAE